MLRDFATLARLPNLPTVWSNVTCSYLLTLGLVESAVAGTKVPVDFDPATLVWLLVSATFLYLHGTFLNDAVDSAYDARHRPERAIPAGRVKADTVLNWALGFGLGGLVAAIPAGRFALAAAAAILVMIGLYTWRHKKSAWAVGFMAMCRGLLVLLGASGALVNWGDEFRQIPIWLVVAAGMLFTYTLGVSLAARGESSGGETKILLAWARGLLCLPFFVPMAVLFWFFIVNPEIAGWQIGALAGALGSVGLAWVWHAVHGAKISVATMVGRALPGLALVDVIILLPEWVNAPGLLAIPLGAFVLSLGIRRWIPAT